MDAHRNCIGFANHYNINNLVCVVKAYTTLGVAIGVVFFGVVRGWFLDFQITRLYIHIFIALCHERNGIWRRKFFFLFRVNYRIFIVYINDKNVTMTTITPQNYQFFIFAITRKSEYLESKNACNLIPYCHFRDNFFHGVI